MHDQLLAQSRYSRVKVNGCVENESLVQILGNVIQPGAKQFIYFLHFFCVTGAGTM